MIKISKTLQTRLNKFYKEYLINGHIFTQPGIKYLGEGSYRVVYALNRDWVLKVDISAYNREDSNVLCNYERGLKSKGLANISEYKAFRRLPSNKAKCRLVPGTNGRFLLMERLSKCRDDHYDFSAKEYKKIPAWAKQMYVDRVQCGYNKKKQLVRFDYQTKFSEYW